MSSLDPTHLNYIPLVPYNGTGATGGDSLTEDFNIWYEVRCGCRECFFKASSNLCTSRLVWELCLDDDFHGARTLDDSWSWVLLFRSCEEKVRPFAYMAVDDVDSCSQLSGTNPLRLTLQPSNTLGSGSSGVIHSHFPTQRPVFLETSITSVFVMFWDKSLSGVQRFQTSCLPSTRECSHASRMLGVPFTTVFWLISLQRGSSHRCCC